MSGSKKDKVRIGTDDDSLVIESLGRTQEREITVSYPKDLRFKDTSIEVAAGTVTMCDDFRTDDLDVSVGAGEFTNTGKISVANDISVEVGTGNVEISELDMHDLEVDCVSIRLLQSLFVYYHSTISAKNKIYCSSVFCSCICCASCFASILRCFFFSRSSRKKSDSIVEHSSWRTPLVVFTW